MYHRVFAAITALLLVLSLAACQAPAVKDSGTPNESVSLAPTSEAFRADCLDYAKKAFDVEPGKDGINEDSIFLTVAPALAGFWRVDIAESPTEEEYDAFMTAFEQSEFWDHGWDEIQTELTYEQSAQVLARLMDFCYNKAVETGWTPGQLPEFAPIPESSQENSDTQTDPEPEN